MADAEILIDFLPRFRMFKSGRVERFAGTDIAAPGLDSATGVLSKDLLILPNAGVKARLYLPEQPSPPTSKLPVLLYFHGGGFCIETAFSPTYHNYLNSLVSQANLVAVSVNYRRAPEHLLPAAYEDAWEALQWVAANARGGTGEEWLVEHGDFSRVYVAGDSAGANIVNQVALRAGVEEIGHGVELEGAVLVHPYFWSTTEKDSACEVERLWKIATPAGTGVDHPWFNPVAETAPRLAGLACRRVVVCVAEEDKFAKKGKEYCEMVKESGWPGCAELWVAEKEEHVFHLKKPECDNALSMRKRMASFFNSVLV